MRRLALVLTLLGVSGTLLIPTSLSAVTICSGPDPLTWKGTRGPDYQQGDHELADVMHARAGADSLVGWGGDDYLCGGAGPDGLRGKKGADFLDGGAGNDGRLEGGAGPNVIRGNRGSDWLEDFDGDDWGGDDAPDAFLGGKGSDYCSGDEWDTYKECERISFGTVEDN
jgi:Ca2+-binding RTX toxin-like protein